MNSRYCITFNIMNTGEKIKIDYGCVPIENLKLSNGVYICKSSVSNEIFTLVEKRFGFIYFLKKENQVVFQCVFKSFYDDLSCFETECIPFCVKYICKRIPFRFKYKKVLRERAKKILG